ncbi:hypothetical protein [Aurantiacibacter spongiae]|uniref:hypothetical protein n=1 Tax=Aurantiacibacter spongiae TaxID=2488860 RepID=UPI002D789B1E|nr:hypothetical protein [Aurantiacibacter spongiae]
MTMLFIVISLIGVAGFGTLALCLALVVPPIHVYRQLRGAYGLSRRSTIWRLLILSAFIWIAVALFVNILFLLGAM